MSWQQYAQKYFDKNLDVIPLKGKRPFTKDWVNKDHSKAIYNVTNLGLKTGEHSGVICIDIDTKDKKLKKKIYDLLPPILCGKTGDRDKGINYFFAYNGEANKKIRGVVEILSTGNQTVLPPSIHPDKNYPYQWVGKSLLDIDIDQLPFLPEDFLENLEKLLGGEDAPSASTAVIKSDGSRCNHNSHNRLSQFLTAKIGDGKSPDEIVNELIEEDKIINPEIPYFLCKTGRWKTDSLELNAYDFVLKSYKNMFKRGDIAEISTGATWLPRIEEPEEAEIYEKNFKKLPHLIGVGEEIFKDMYNNSPISRSQLCFMNTINLISMLISNKIFFKGTGANLYQYGIAPSGYGKDFSFRRGKQLLHEIEAQNLIGSSSPTSESVVLTVLDRGRERCFFINEAESLLKKLNDARLNHSLREVLTDLYDAAGRRNTPKAIMENSRGKADLQIMGDIYSPYVNILMTSTVSAFEQHAGIDLFNTGFGSRFLFYFEDRFKRQRLLKNYNNPPSRDLIAKLRIMNKVGERISLDASAEFKVNNLETTKECDEFYEKIFNKLEDEKERNQETKFLGILSRKLLFINKFTLIHHTMMNPINYMSAPVEAASLAWSFNAIDAITHNMMQHLGDSVNESKYGGVRSKFIKYIKSRSSKEKATSIRDIHNRFNSIQITERKKILQDLMESGNITKKDDGSYIIIKNNSL